MRLRSIAVLSMLASVAMARASAQAPALPPAGSDGGQGFGYLATAGIIVMIVAALAWTVLRGKTGAAADAQPRVLDSEFHRAAAASTPPRARSTSRRSIFLSYRREDSADITGRITDRLVERYGKDSIFKDVDSIPLGRDFRTHLQQAVGRCDALLVIIGRHWCDASAHGQRRLDDSRDHLRIEIESALERDIPVIPVLVQGAAMPEAEALPESIRPLAYRNGVLVRPDPDFNGDLDRLMRGMDTQFDGDSGPT